MHVRELDWNCKAIDCEVDATQEAAQARAIEQVRDHLHKMISSLDFKQEKK